MQATFIRQTIIRVMPFVGYPSLQTKIIHLHKQQKKSKQTEN